MPPRHAYWTILIDDQPTAFRAHDPEELLATLNRLKEKHPSAVMKWFERGKLWESRDAAREEGLGQGERRWEGPRPDRTEGAPTRARDRNWRPGGEHRDPRQKYKDAKKAKWDRLKKNIRERSDRAHAAKPVDPEARKFSPPHGDPLRDQIERPPERRRPESREGHTDWRPKGPPRGDRPGGDRPRDDRPRGENRGGWQGRDDRKPGGWRPEGPPRRDRPMDRDRGDWRDRPRDDRPRDDRPRGESRGGWQGRDDRKPGAWRPKGPPRADRPPDRERGDWRDRPRPDRERGEWRPHPKDTRDQSARPKGPPSGANRYPAGPKSRPPGSSLDKPRARKPWGSKPPGAGGWKGGGKGPVSRGSRRPPAGGRPPHGAPGPRGPRGPRRPRKPRDDE